jgi:hypothetical protein
MGGAEGETRNLWTVGSMAKYIFVNRLKLSSHFPPFNTFDYKIIIKQSFTISRHLFTMTDQPYKLQLTIYVSYDGTQAGRIAYYLAALSYPLCCVKWDDTVCI